MTNIRTWLVLGRVSNLPTVWSNGLCAWVLGGGGNTESLIALLLGISLLYIGGMYLNDYCDVVFDDEHHPDRPIPAGKISRNTVLVAATIQLTAGLLVLIWTDLRTLLFGSILLGLIVLYNLVHKRTWMGVPLMAACRTAIYPTIGEASETGMNPLIWSAGVMMFYYVLGVTILARIEAKSIKTLALASAFIILPLIGSLYLAGPPFGIYFPVTFCLPALWIAWSFSHARKEGKLILGQTVGPLLAGICLIDLAIVNSMNLVSFTLMGFFLVFFFTSLLAQRYIPAS